MPSRQSRVQGVCKGDILLEVRLVFDNRIRLAVDCIIIAWRWATIFPQPKLTPPESPLLLERGSWELSLIRLKESCWNGWEGGAGLATGQGLQISEPSPRDFIGSCPRSTGDVLDGYVHLTCLNHATHASRVAFWGLWRSSVHTLPGKCTLSMTRPKHIIYVAAVYRHPMTLLHPPGEEVSNSRDCGAYPDCQPSRRRESPMTCHTRCSCSVLALSRLALCDPQ